MAALYGEAPEGKLDHLVESSTTQRGGLAYWSQRLLSGPNRSPELAVFKANLLRPRLEHDVRPLSSYGSDEPLELDPETDFPI